MKGKTEKEDRSLDGNVNDSLRFFNIIKECRDHKCEKSI